MSHADALKCLQSLCRHRGLTLEFCGRCRRGVVRRGDTLVLMKHGGTPSEIIETLRRTIARDIPIKLGAPAKNRNASRANRAAASARRDAEMAGVL
jgi:hypothetical protein